MNQKSSWKLNRVLNDTRGAIGKMEPFSNQDDQLNIKISLNALEKYYEFCQNANDLSWQDTKSLLSSCQLSKNHLKKVGNPVFLKHMQIVYDVITNSYPWPYVPPEKIKLKLASLVDALKKYIAPSVDVQMSKVENQFKPKIKGLYNILNDTRCLLPTIGYFSDQVDQDNIRLTLKALEKYYYFCQEPNEVSWKDAEKSFTKCEVSKIHLKRVGNPLLLKQMQKVINVILNSYHWPYIPPAAIQLELACLVDDFKKYVNTVHPVNYSTIMNKVKAEDNSIDSNSKSLSSKISNDTLFFNLVQKVKLSAVDLNRKRNKPTAPIQDVLSKFSYALKCYMTYCESSVKYYYQPALFCLPHYTCINYENTDSMTMFLKLVQKICNFILYTFPDFHIPSEAVIDELQRLLKSLNMMKTKTSSWSSERNYDETLQNMPKSDTAICFSAITKIKNVIRKSFKELVPSEKVQMSVIMSIDALNTYMVFFSNGKKVFRVESIQKLKDIKLYKVSHMQKPETDLQVTLQRIKEFVLECYMPPKRVQKRLRNLKITLEKWACQWNQEESVGSSRVIRNNPNPYFNIQLSRQSYYGNESKIARANQKQPKSDVSRNYRENPNSFIITRDRNSGALVVALDNQRLVYSNDSFTVMIDPLESLDPRALIYYEITTVLFDYNAFLLIPDEDDFFSYSKNNWKLEFPNVSKFLTFVQEHGDMVERLNLVSQK